MPSVKSEVRDQRSEVGPAAADGCAHEPLTTQHPAPSTSAKGKQYWRSLDELADTKEFREFVHREFPAGATELLNSGDRRQFLKIMGASMALAGLGMAGCRRWPEEKIAEYAHRPPGHNPGTTNHFATCMDIGGVASGLLVTSFDYRPIKIEGNPQHPINQGATDALMQASILDLYDPDRSQFVLREGKKSDWATFAAWAKDHFGGLRNSRGNGLAFLSEASSSPSVAAMRQRVKQMFAGATWHEFEPLSNDNELKGTMLAFGGPFRAHYSFFDDKTKTIVAKTIVALDSDFLHCDPAAIKWTREFAKTRKADDRRTMSRLYSFESGVSLTGANADHRIAMRSADVAVVAARILAAVDPSSAAALQPLTAASISTALDSKDLEETIQHVISDLNASKGASIVIAGKRQPPEVHLLVHLINQALGNNGKTITFTQLPDAMPHLDSIRSLAADMSAGKVQTLVIVGGNPAYNAPVELKFADALKNVQTTVHLSDYVDETSKRCTWHVNRAHYLETWGDGRAYDGTISVAQPMIETLFGGKSPIELLATITGDDHIQGDEIVRRTIQAMGSGADFEAFWRKALYDGFIGMSAAHTVNPPIATAMKLDQQAHALSQRWAAAKPDDLEAVFVQDVALYDGRYANNGWLQELPDPIAKLTWDNAIYMAPSAAKQRDLSNGDMVTLSCNGERVQAPVWIVPGQYAGSVTLPLGYGREFEGRICKDAGFNFYKVRGGEGVDFATAHVSKTGDYYKLVTTQDHHPVDTVGGKGEQERLPTLFREGTITEYERDKDFANHRTHVVHRLSMWDEDFKFHTNDGVSRGEYAWAMSIDLNSCTGCNACVIACQAENNIPIVGKEQVGVGREMHWIRVDRYFKFKPAKVSEHGEVEEWNGDAVENFMLSPVTCNHCENAPCEQVCPVAATSHDENGLNMMVYNRCVGTRYCSNNCPYKVRRFNFFDFHVRKPHRERPYALLQVDPDYYTKGSAEADPLKQMQFNPEVTVRMRGVMEKCTYCIQRISAARVQAKNDWVKTKDIHPDDPSVQDARVPIRDGAITPACAQACPAQAIVFGDLNDRGSRIAALHKHERSYQMLEELNTKPRTRYMAKLRNPPTGAAGSAGEAHHG